MQGFACTVASTHQLHASIMLEFQCIKHAFSGYAGLFCTYGTLWSRDTLQDDSCLLESEECCYVEECCFLSALRVEGAKLLISLCNQSILICDTEATLQIPAPQCKLGSVHVAVQIV
jgi:hypothetical protein